MTQTDGFKHISVKRSIPDDVIIYAGISNGDDGVTASTSNAFVDESQVAETPVSHSQVDDSRSALAPVSHSQERELDDFEKSLNATIESNATKNSKRKKDSYHETTLEDLQGIKMPLTQKVVIITAILLILIACFYYFAVLR